MSPPSTKSESPAAACSGPCHRNLRRLRRNVHKQARDRNASASFFESGLEALDDYQACNALACTDIAQAAARGCLEAKATQKAKLNRSVYNAKG